MKEKELQFDFFNKKENLTKETPPFPFIPLLVLLLISFFYGSFFFFLDGRGRQITEMEKSSLAVKIELQEFKKMGGMKPSDIKELLNNPSKIKNLDFEFSISESILQLIKSPNLSKKEKTELINLYLKDFFPRISKIKTDIPQCKTFDILCRTVISDEKNKKLEWTEQNIINKLFVHNSIMSNFLNQKK